MRTSDRDDEFRDFVLEERAQLVRAATVLSAGDPHLAEDLVQIALTRIYVAWPRIRGSNVIAYARRVLVNALIDEKRRPAAKRERNVAEVPDQLDPAQDVLDSDAPLLEALARLPAGMRAAVVLRHVQDLSVEQTADILGCSAGAVKSQTARGLQRLRELLAQSAPSTSS